MNVVSHECGLLWTRSVMNQVCHERGLSLMWSVMDMVCNEGDCYEYGL